MRVFANSKRYYRDMPADFHCRHKWVILSSTLRWCFDCGGVMIGPVGKRSSRVLVPKQALPDNGPWFPHETEQSRRSKLRELKVRLL